MGSKKNRTTIGNINNRQEYAIEHTRCESCNGTMWLAIHHHIRQTWKYLGDEYVLELSENYSTLCSDCHAIIEHNENQYNRQLFPKNHIHYDYWHKLKNGKEPEEYLD